VESLDRLTREDILVAVNLVSGILLKGIRIVQLHPVEMVYDEKAAPHEIMLMIVELGEDEAAEDAELRFEYDRVVAQIAQLEAASEEGDVIAVARLLRAKEAEKSEIAARMEAARHALARPASQAFRDARALSGLLGGPDDEDVRLRLRSAVRRVIDSIHMLAAGRGKDRTAFVQLNFTSGAVRRCRIWHQGATGNAGGRRPGKWLVLSVTHKAGDPNVTDGYDLRKPKEAAKMLAILEESVKLDPEDERFGKVVGCGSGGVVE
jgi:hypothetical protein